MTAPPPEYSGPRKPRIGLIRALCYLRLDGHEYRSTDVLDLPSGWLACTDKRCQRCGKWLICGGRLVG